MVAGRVPKVALSILVVAVELVEVAGRLIAYTGGWKAYRMTKRSSTVSSMVSRGGGGGSVPDP